MLPDDYDHLVALEEFIAEHTRESEHNYVDIRTIYAKFRPSERLYLHLRVMEDKQYIYCRTDDDDILGVWGYDKLFEKVGDGSRSRSRDKEYWD